MDIHIKISDEQIQTLKDFGLGGILNNVMRGLGDDVIKDIQSIERKRGPKWFFNQPKVPFMGFNIPSRTIPEDKRTLTPEDIKSTEDFAKKELYKDIKVLFDTRTKGELLKLVLERLGPHSLALLIQK